jgi:hypothetical protein
MRLHHALATLLVLTGCIVEEDPELTATDVAAVTIPTEPTTLVRRGSGKCLDVDGAGSANGTRIQQWVCNGTGAQAFRLEDRGNGIYRVRNTASDKCLDVAGGGTGNGTRIQLWSCGGGGNQKFRIQELGDGWVRLRHPASNKCVDVSGASGADGAQVQLWSCNGTDAQSWAFGGGGGDDDDLEWRQANLTWFTSWPDPGSEECEEYNGCTWAGYFAFVDGQRSEEWVSQHDIAAVHSRDAGEYALKTLRLRQGGREIDVVVYDMCSDSDCDGCCTRNASETGFLIDLESYTMERFGSGDGIVEWACLDC